MMDQDAEMFDLYLQDMREHLELLNESLLLLEKDLDDRETVNTIFRAFHTMKGSTATMGYAQSAEIIHRMEDLLQGMRDGRITADADIMQLLFSCYDFIEKVVDLVSSTGSEEGIECSDMMEQLDIYTGVQAAVKDDAETSAQEAGGEQIEITATRSELEYIKIKAAAGYRPYTVDLELAPDCLFKTIRAWMAYEELERTAEIIKSYPDKPDREEFDNGSFVFNGTEIKALVVSARTGEDIWNDLHSSLMEIEEIAVEEYALEQEMVNSIIEGNADGVNMSGSVFPESILKEIRNQASLSELACLDAVSDLENGQIINRIWHPFHLIKELAAHIDHSVIYNIAAGTESLLDSFLKKRDNLDDNNLNYVAESLASIKALCDDTSLLSNREYLQDIDRHLNVLFSQVNGAPEKNQPDNVVPQQNGLRLGEILVKKGAVDQQSVDYLIDKQRESYPGLKFGQVALKEEKTSLKNVVEALGVQSGARSDQKSQSFIRIPEQKVDSLVDMLGELLITQSLHKQEISDLLAETSLNSKISNNILRMERITKDIQTISMSLRMVSLKQSFQKLLRVGRDTARDLGKDVSINLSGEDTEIDRSVVEKIQDPLMHLVRNAISHGIETEDNRLAHDKTAQGRVNINAYNKRGFVYIEVADDGNGLEVEKLYKKAKEKSLIDPDRRYSEDEILKFIYLPGFSTQENIDSISGRGVGMNVVETEILNIGGKVEISNRPGNGCTFTLKIPINLATINGTIIDVFGGRYILPTLNIKQLVKPDISQWVNIQGKPEMVQVREEIIQVIPIDKILGLGDADIDFKDAVIIVLELENMMKALPVSSVLGKQEIVVKPLGAEFRGLDFISGATILGDGRVSLILDVETLFKLGAR